MKGEFEGIYRVASSSFSEIDNLITKQATIIRQEYWDLIKAQVSNLKNQRNLTVQKVSRDDFLASTFIQYTPVVRSGRSKTSITWQSSIKMISTSQSKKQLAGNHIKMNEPASSSMPGSYSKAKFPLDAQAAWQLEYIMRAEIKFNMLRVLIHKLAIPNREVLAVTQAFDKSIDNMVEISDPKDAHEINNDLNPDLMKLREMLIKNGEDINALPKVSATLLMQTDSKKLVDYGIDPELKDMYFH